MILQQQHQHFFKESLTFCDETKVFIDYMCDDTCILYSHIDNINAGIIIIIDQFYIALFSALKQTHCTHFVCDSE